MTKNITVIDEKGNILYSTYPKRAKGLVRKGRARWIDADAIRLDAPSYDMEDNTMANNIYDVFDNQLSKMQDSLRNENGAAAMPVRIQILKTMEVFRAQEQGAKVIDMVKAQLDTMQSALNEEAPIPENALARETTRQKMLELMQTFTIGGSGCNNTAAADNTQAAYNAAAPAVDNTAPVCESDNNSAFAGGDNADCTGSDKPADKEE